MYILRLKIITAKEIRISFNMFQTIITYLGTFDRILYEGTNGVSATSDFLFNEELSTFIGNGISLPSFESISWYLWIDTAFIFCTFSEITVCLTSWDGLLITGGFALLLLVLLKIPSFCNKFTNKGLDMAIFPLFDCITDVLWVVLGLKITKQLLFFYSRF